MPEPPHAVCQFQSRIAPWMSYEEALGTMIRALRGARDFHVTGNGKTRYVGTAGEWQFRAVIADGAAEGLPVVITILRGGKGRKRRSRPVEKATVSEG